MLTLTDLASVFTIAGVFVAVGLYWFSRRPIVEARATRSVWPRKDRPDIQVRFLNRGSRPVTVTHIGFSLLGQRYSVLHEVTSPQTELMDGQSCTLSVSSYDFASQLGEMLVRDKVRLPKKESAWKVSGVFIISIDDAKHFNMKMDAEVCKALIGALNLGLKSEGQIQAT